VRTEQDDVSVNVLIIDDQHEVFFQLIRRLESAMKNGRGALMISALIEELKQYTVIHFGTEELLMQSYEYPLRDSHRVEHDKARARLQEVGTEITAIEMLDELRDWIRRHIAKWDLMLGEYLNDRGID